MKALILAAGYATRLYPLTENQPKPLLEVGKKAILAHLLDKLKEVKGLKEVFVVTNHRFYDRFRSWLVYYTAPFKIKLIDDGTLSNEDRLGAIGDLNFVLKEEEINRERGVILEEMKMYWDDPRRYVWSLLEGLIYGDNSYGWDVLGPARNIQKIKRSAFVNYWRSQYVASNTIVVIAGNVSESTTFSKVESVFSGLRTGKYAKEPPMKKVILGPRVRIFEKNTDQSHVVIGALGYSLEHKDRLVADVLSTILGGYMSSRLWSDIRGKHGLAYHVHAEHQPYKHTGYFAAYAGVPHERREETIRRIIGHLEKIKKSGVTKEELSRAKENIKGRMAISLESSDEVATFLGTQEVLLGKIKTPDELKKRIEKITGEDIARVAKSLFQKDKVYLAIIGPHLKEEAYDGILRSI